jgi:Lrp/AsnC ligand binding domain
MHTFILIEAEVGKASDVAAEAGRIDGVSIADVVSGPYDVILEVQSDGFADVARRVVGRIHDIDGVTRTLTCPVVELHEQGIERELRAVFG